MDDPSIDPSQHRQALRGLARLNSLSFASGALWGTIASMARKRGLGRARLLDVACGGGDVAIGIARQARTAGFELQIEGCDLSPTAVEHAQAVAAAQGFDGIRFFVHNVFEQPLPEGFDFVTCTLFLHHLSEDQAVELLQRLGKAATHGVLIDDLARSRAAYALAWCACRMLSRSAVVHYDGPVSVRGAFTPEEAISLASRAGIDRANCRRHWPLRYLLSWEVAG